MSDKNVMAERTDLFFKAIAGDAVEATCVGCKAVEMVIPLDEPIDELFLANYFCDECEDAEDLALPPIG